MAENRTNSRVFLLSSIILGVVAMVAAFVWLENSAGQDRGPKTTILVAKRDLRTSTALDPDKDLVELEIPATQTELRSRGLTPETKTAYKGQRINRDILAGTPVFIADLAAAATLELRGDARALSIQVKGSAALGGLLIPGDYVKVLVTRPRHARPTTLPAEGEPPVAAEAGWETVIVSPQAFRVIAINQRLSRSRSQLTAADQYQSAGESTGQQTVTLEVSEAQAKTILEQTGGGGGQLPITLLLCPPP